jgi:short-subunit dehydrogenase
MKNPRHILITGASSGIGAALALAYAAKGVVLSLHGRDAARLQKIAAQAHAQGADVTLHRGDVTNAAEIAIWIREQDQKTPLDLVIANAGISGGTFGGPESDAQVRAIFSVNVDGVINTVQPALALMSEHRRGQIAIISSLASFRGFPGAPAYCASKAAVRVYGEGLRGAAAPYGVEINIVCPGFIKTPMTDANPFPMPLMIRADRAAHLIRKGLAANRARIAFPLSMYAAIRFLAALPQALIDLIAQKTPKK